MKLDIILSGLIDKYQEFTKTTAIYPGANTGDNGELFYLFCGLLGEEQEWYESNYDMKEAGDIFWYLSQLCSWKHYSLWQLFNEVEPKQYSKPNVHEAMKKYIRDDKNPWIPLWDYMKAVLGYVLYRYNYSVNNPPLEEAIKQIIMINTDKLTDRKNRDVLKGDGNDR